MKAVTFLGLLVSLVAADRTSYPSAWWSGSTILSGDRKYVTTPVSTDELVQAFSKSSHLLMSHEDASVPEVVLFVVCDKLKKDDFTTYGTMKSLEGVIARSKSSVLIPQTMAGEKSAHDILAASASLFSGDSSDLSSRVWSIATTSSKKERRFSSVKEFLAASKTIFSNGKTDFVVVSLPPQSADHALEMLDTALNKLTSGNYLAGVISEAYETGTDAADESAPAARKLLAVPAPVVPPLILIQANTLRITPGILLGIILTFVMIMFLYIGMCGMMDMGVNDQFWPKEKDDRGRPLKGKVES